MENLLQSLVCDTGVQCHYWIIIVSSSYFFVCLAVYPIIHSFLTNLFHGPNLVFNFHSSKSYIFPVLIFWWIDFTKKPVGTNCNCGFIIQGWMKKKNLPFIVYFLQTYNFIWNFATRIWILLVTLSAYIIKEWRKVVIPGISPLMYYKNQVDFGLSYWWQEWPNIVVNLERKCLE